MFDFLGGVGMTPNSTTKLKNKMHYLNAPQAHFLCLWPGNFSPAFGPEFTRRVFFYPRCYGHFLISVVKKMIVESLATAIFTQ